MSETIANNKRIAKNTVFLYLRMFLIMGVSLYTSRVVLDKLGVTDYSLYGVVGGVVSMLSFLNGTLTIGTTRFITFELGRGDKKRLSNTFITSFYVHLILALVVLIVMETCGLWFFYNKLIIPSDRIESCFWVFQLSLITTFVNITQVPYSSLVSSHEHFNIYAYVSIFEALAKLGVCYVLLITALDRLIIYASLLAVIQLLVAIFYRLYCIRNFEESRLKLVFNKIIFRGLLSFSGWNIIANMTEMLKHQGVVILINMFFNPVVVASQTLANQVSTQLMGFINNFRMAFNPQIIKLYASGEKDASKRMTLQTTVICFDMILFLALPCIYTMKTIMGVWLVVVPDYAVIFTQCVLACNVLGIFSASFYTPMMAANKIRFNSISSVFLGLLQFVVLYLILKFGGGPMWVPIMNIIIVIGFAYFVKPYVLWKDIEYSLGELVSCYWACGKVLFASLVITIPCRCILDDSIIQSVLMFCISMLAVGSSSLIFMEKHLRKKLIEFVINKLRNKCKSLQ